MAVIISFLVLLVIIFIFMIILANKTFNRDVGSATAHLGQMAADYSKKEEEIQKKFDELKSQGQHILETAQNDAEQLKQRILKDIEGQKEKILAEAQGKVDEMMQQADRARKVLLEEVEKRIEDKATEKAAELLREVIPEDVRSRVHEYWMSDLMGGNFAQLERLHLQEGATEAVVVSAYGLTDAQRQVLFGKIKEKLGAQIQLKEEIDNNIIAGLYVTVGSLILDGSLRFKIQEACIARQSK